MSFFFSLSFTIHFYVPLPLLVYLSLFVYVSFPLCLPLSLPLSQHPLFLDADIFLHLMKKCLNGNLFNFSDKQFNFFTFLLGYCDVLMGALCIDTQITIRSDREFYL